MKTKKINLCTQVRTAKTGFFGRVGRTVLCRLDKHIASCPRCQKRLYGTGRVELALKLMLSQPHSMNLLARANHKALNMLCHDVRFSEKADQLRVDTPRPNWTQRHRKMIEYGFNLAACMAVVCLMKTGVFSSMKKYQDDGRNVIQNYYARHLDSETMNELFPQS